MSTISLLNNDFKRTKYEHLLKPFAPPLPHSQPNLQHPLFALKIESLNYQINARKEAVKHECKNYKKITYSLFDN